MYTITGYLYKKDKLFLRGVWEDLAYFVEELKRTNPKFIDRTEFKIYSSGGDLIKEWKRK